MDCLLSLTLLWNRCENWRHACLPCTYCVFVHDTSDIVVWFIVWSFLCTFPQVKFKIFCWICCHTVVLYLCFMIMDVENYYQTNILVDKPGFTNRGRNLQCGIIKLFYRKLYILNDVLEEIKHKRQTRVTIRCSYTEEQILYFLIFTLSSHD